MARRIAGVGRVTVSLRKSINLFNADKLLEDFVRNENATFGQPDRVALSRHQPVGDKAADRLAEPLPFFRARTYAFTQAQTDEEFFFRRMCGCAFQPWRLASLPTVDVFPRRLDVLKSQAAVEGMRIGPESRVRLQAPVLQIVHRLKTRSRKVGDLIAIDPLPRQFRNGGLVHVDDQSIVPHLPRSLPLSPAQHLLAHAA